MGFTIYDLFGKEVGMVLVGGTGRGGEPATVTWRDRGHAEGSGPSEYRGNVDLADLGGGAGPTCRFLAT